MTLSSSRKTDTFRPFAVPAVYSCRGCVLDEVAMLASPLTAFLDELWGTKLLEMAPNRLAASMTLATPNTLVNGR